MPRIENSVLNLRDEEPEGTVVIPLVARPAPTRVEPLTTTATVRIEHARAAIGILDRLVHGGNPPDTEFLKFRIREQVSEKASRLGVRREPSPLLCVRTDLLRNAIAIRVGRADDDGQGVGDAVGCLEVRRPQDILGILREAEAFRFEIGDPVFAASTVRGDFNIDHIIDPDPFFAFGDLGCNAFGDDRDRGLTTVVEKFGESLSTFFGRKLDERLEIRFNLAPRCVQNERSHDTPSLTFR